MFDLEDDDYANCESFKNLLLTEQVSVVQVTEFTQSWKGLSLNIVIDRINVSKL